MTEAFESARAMARERSSVLEIEDLRALAESAWWAGDGVTSMTLGEEVYRRLDEENRFDEAAMQALDLGLEWVTSGEVTIGSAWLARARRVLDGLGPADAPVARGYLRFVETSFELDVDGDPREAEQAAADLAVLGRSHPESPLVCFSGVLEGMAAVRGGRTDDGFRALDDAMLEVLDGRVPPKWSGDIYCTVIQLAHVLADWGRMRAWTDALDRWATPLSRAFMYSTVTQVHRMQLVAAEGGWDEVLAGLEDSSATLVGSHGWLAGEGYRELGDILRLRGRLEEASAAYRRTRDLGVDPQPGEALLAHGAGRTAEAVTGLRAALEGQGALERARLLLPAVEIALVIGDTGLARSASEELRVTATLFATPGLLAWADHAHGLVALADSREADAIASLESALRTYRGQRLRYAVARVHEDLASARREAGEDAAADADAATALSIYRELGAKPDIARLSPDTRPGGLTTREVEVLRLVARGSSNRVIAAELVISEKTVSRHLANLFIKIGIGSRTAAAAWAHANGIHDSSHTRS